MLRWLRKELRIKVQKQNKYKLLTSYLVMPQELFFKISTSNETVKNHIKDKIKSSLQALGEYIWNSIDANAENIYIDIKVHGELLREITIKDDGSGINYEDIQKDLFKILGDTPKSKEHKDYLSVPHGKNGAGRFAFIQFAHQVNWITVYSTNEGNFKYEISIDGNSLNNVEKIMEKEKTKEKTGTIVKITRIDIKQDLIKKAKKPLEHIKDYLIQEFYPIIKLRNIKI
jgi:DNA topoisomerase VI subunit B